MKNLGLIFVLSGPSGSGKTTLHDRLLKVRAVKLVRSISCTTRAPRYGEKNGIDYFFITREEFFARKRNGEFLETQRVFNSFYGTPKEFVEETIARGRDILLCIDVKGAMAVKKQYPKAVLIFVEPPSLSELAARLDRRSTENTYSKALRLKIAKNELRYKKYYDYVVENKDISNALKSIKEIVAGEKVFKARRS